MKPKAAECVAEPSLITCISPRRHHKAERIYTLNSSHFENFRRGGDPTIVHP